MPFIIDYSCLVREIQFCKFSEIFLGCFVVCFCGFYFVFEYAEKNRSAVNAYHSNPLFRPLAIRNSLIFRVSCLRSLPRVPTVLRASCRSQVRLSVIEGSAVNMVADQAVGCIRYFAVHANNFCPFAVSVRFSTDGIKSIITSAGGVPFVFAKPVIVIRIDNGVLALRQGNSPESVAVAQPAIQ